MTQTTNPWVVVPDVEPAGEPHGAVVPTTVTPVAGGRLFLAGAHGGAGVSTLVHLVPALREVGPRIAAGDRLVVVCRSSASGLQAAQRVLAYLASPSSPAAHVEGLIVSADAPGRTPRPLHDLTALLSGATPRTWLLPWVEDWRFDPYSVQVPRAVRAVLGELTELAGGLPSVHNNRKA